MHKCPFAGECGSADESPNMEGWTVAERFIVARLDRIENKQDAHATQLTTLNGEMSGMKVKTSILSGTISVFVGVVGWLIRQATGGNS